VLRRAGLSALVGRDLGDARTRIEGRRDDGRRRIDADAICRDPTAAGERAAQWLANAGTGAWLHVDLDVMDPVALPAVSYPQPSGLDWDQLTNAVTPLARSRRLLGVSLADFRPDLDPTGEHAGRIVDFCARTLP
jgi:arginase